MMEDTVNMQDTEVLWIDDDISTKNTEIMKKLEGRISGIKLLTAKSCGESEKILKSRVKPPQWAIVDLIIPQGEWDRDQYHSNPGIEYIKHLKSTYRDNIKIFAFCLFVDGDIETKVKSAGALEALGKLHISFAGVLEKIQSNQKTDDGVSIADRD